MDAQMTVYIVIEHDWEDDNIIGVYESENDANIESLDHAGSTVEEYEVK